MKSDLRGRARDAFINEAPHHGPVPRECHHRCGTPPIFTSRYAFGDPRLYPVAFEGRPCPSPTSPAFFVKPKTVPLHPRPLHLPS